MTLVVGVCVMATVNAFGLGADYPAGQRVYGSDAWPKGMDRLVNATNRVHGFFVNAEDVFFFAGTATNLSAFLLEYSQLQGVEKHCLILHPGRGEAKSPWDKTGQPCDWKLDGCPKSWRTLGTLSGTNSVEQMQKAASDPGYLLEVHLWTDSRIELDQVAIPKNITVEKEVLTNAAPPEPSYETAEQIKSMPPCKARLIQDATCVFLFETDYGRKFWIGSPGNTDELLQFLRSLKAGPYYKFPDVFLEFKPVKEKEAQ